MRLLRSWLVITICSWSSLIFAQSFQRTYGTGADMQAFCVSQTNDGGFIVCGNISLDPINTNICLLKTNAIGDTLWMKHYGGSGGEYEGIVQQTWDGGYIIAGTTHSFGAGQGDILVIKTDQNGDTLWTRTYGGTGEEIGQSIQQTFDGGYIIGGHTGSFGIKGDFYLLRTNSVGDTVWTRNYGGSQHDHGFCVQQTSDSGFVLAGHSVSFGVSGGFYIVRTNAAGDTLWSRGYGGMLDSYCYSIAQTGNGGFILAGTTTSFGAGGTDAMVVKTDAMGDTVWTRTYGTAGDEYFNCVKAIPGGGYILTGSTTDGIDGSEVYLVRIDEAGDTLWSRTFGGLKDDEGSFVDVCSDSGYVVCGYTKSMLTGHPELYLLRTDRDGRAGCAGRVVTSVIARPDSVMYMVTTMEGASATQVGGAGLTRGGAALNTSNSCSSFGIATFSSDEFSVKLYPCPVTDALHIQSEQELGLVRIYDSYGRLCLEAKNDTFETDLKMGRFTPGLYLVEVGGRHFRIAKQ